MFSSWSSKCDETVCLPGCQPGLGHCLYMDSPLKASGGPRHPEKRRGIHWSIQGEFDELRTQIYTGGICSVYTLLNHTGVFGTASIPYVKIPECLVRPQYTLSNYTGVSGMGSTPVPDTLFGKFVSPTNNTLGTGTPYTEHTVGNTYERWFLLEWYDISDETLVEFHVRFALRSYLWHFCSTVSIEPLYMCWATVYVPWFGIFC